MSSFPFKSYCRCVGTTSFRASHLNFKIERQLQLINNFWDSLPSEDRVRERRPDIQQKFYDLLKSEGFVTGNARYPGKDARQKTSSLRDLGLVTDDRKITSVGLKIKNISETGRNQNNLFHIDSDSFIYLLQLLKITEHKDSDGIHIKPFISFLYLLEKLEYLTFDEFTYFLPLCKTNMEVIELKDSLINIRQENDGDNDYIDDYIINKMMNMQNYQGAYNYFIRKQHLSREDFIIIGMNRDGGKYDGNYYDIYNALYDLVFIERNSSIDSRKPKYIKFFETVKKISGNSQSHRKRYFNLLNRRSFDEEYDVFFKSMFSGINNEAQFKSFFFSRLHLFKRKSTLEDYSDLNYRYFSLSDIIQYNEGKFELSLLPKHYFKDIIDGLLNEELLSGEEYNNFMFSEKNINEISSLYPENATVAINEISEEVGEELSIENINSYLDNQRLQRFKQLISERFGNDVLLSLISNLEVRNDSKVMEIIGTNNASPSTIFEYVVGIIWYKISGETGNILDFMGLSLDANLLPKTHAQGLQSDIVYKYDETEEYPNHDLLIEVTLSENLGQRNMEMEPVQRHLGEHKLATNNENDYSLFIAANLREDLVLAFRGMKAQTYGFTNRGYVTGLKIIPINTSILKQIIEKGLSYGQLYNLFSQAYSSSTNDINWFNSEILEKINNL